MPKSLVEDYAAIRQALDDIKHQESERVNVTRAINFVERVAKQIMFQNSIIHCKARRLTAEELIENEKMWREEYPQDL